MMTGASGAMPEQELRRLVAWCDRELAPHMDLEDRVLFPALERDLLNHHVTLEPLRQEHVDLRLLLSDLVQLLDQPAGGWRDERLGVQWRDLVELLRLHVRKEERLLLRFDERERKRETS